LIIHDLNYDELWKQKFLSEFNKTAKVRKSFCVLKKGSFAAIRFKKVKIKFEIFKKFWNLPLFEKILYFI